MNISDESSYELLYEKKISADKGEENFLFSLPPYKAFLENLEDVYFTDNLEKHLNVHPHYEQLGVVKYMDTNGNFPDLHDVMPYNNDGKLHGVRRIYFDNQNNSNLKCELTYQNGCLHGTAKYYTEDGILAEDCDYYYGKKTIERKYDSKGNLKEEYEYGTDKKIKRQYIQNKLSSEEHYLSDGSYYTLTYDKNEKLKSEEKYNKEGKHIVSIEYNNIDNSYNADKTVTEYYDDYYHNIKSKGTYRDNKPVGQHKYYYRSGQIAHIKSFNQSGKKEGSAVSYHENGNIKALGTFKEDEIDGPFYGFNEQGELKHLGFFDNGKDITNEVIKSPSAISKNNEIKQSQNINEQQTAKEKDPLSSLEPHILKRLDGELNALREFKNSDIDDQTKEEFVQMLNEEMSSKGKNGMGLTPVQIKAVKQRNPDLFPKETQNNFIQQKILADQLFNVNS